MQALEYHRVEARLEALCQKGCRRVRQVILDLERGQVLPETQDLSRLECRLLLVELKQIMSVYGDSCQVD